MVGLVPKDHILHIIGDTGEPSIVYNEELRRLCKEDDIELVETIQPGDFKEIIRKYRPEILLIEEGAFNPEEPYRSRSCVPFKLLLVEPGQDKEKLFDYLKQGIDEVIEKDISTQELYLKFFSILRRKKVLELSQLTGLPSINKTYTVIEHCRKFLSDWVVIHVDIMHFQSYNLMYGVSKADDAIRASASMLKDTLKEVGIDESFVGHLGRDSFLIISDSNSLEAITRHIQLNFKDVLGDLYIQSDYDNGYIISSAPNKVRRREGLLDLNIGYCAKIDRSFLSGTDIIEQAIKNKKGPGSDSKRVLVLEDDPDFATLLEDTLLREGNEARVSRGLDQLIEEVAEFEPRVLILEASSIGHQDFVPLCEKLDRYKEELGMKILVATNIPGYQNFLATGADVYIPKPYELETLLKEVRRLRVDYV